MTATYDLSSVTDLNRVRFHTGDTNVSAARWTDAEITYAVGAAGSWQGAVILLLTSLQAKLASTPDYQADWLTESPSKAAASLDRLIKAKRRELGVSDVSATATHQWRPDTAQTEAPYSDVYPLTTGYSTTAGSSGGSGGGSGSVTSIAITVPTGLFTATGSPITTDGTIAINLISQTANQVFAAPNGASGTPSFRALVAADLPDLSGTYAALSHSHAASAITSGTFDAARIPDLSATYALAGHLHAGVYAPVSHAHAAGDVTSGTFDNARVNWAAPGAIGGTTPAQVTATDVVVTGEIKRQSGNLAIRSVDANVLIYAANTLVGGYTSTSRVDYVPFTVAVSSSDTNDIVTAMTLTRTTSDVATTNFGVGMKFNLEGVDAGGINYTYAPTASMHELDLYRTTTAGTKRGVLRTSGNSIYIYTNSDSTPTMSVAHDNFVLGALKMSDYTSNYFLYPAVSGSYQLGRDTYLWKDVRISEYVYWGSSSVDGSWRAGPSGSDLVFERRESGAWVTKSTISA